MQKRGLTESLNNAIEGIAYALKTQRNFRTHLLTGIGILLLSLLAGVNRIEFLILLMTITFVIIAEMLNTTVELVIDLTKGHFHPIARHAKDVAAGGVLIAALSAFCVGCLIFAERFKRFLEGTLQPVRLLPWHVSFMALTFVLIVVIALKFVFRSGTPLRGGMPSGHAAFAFSIWTLVTLLQSNLLVTALVFVLAFLVSLHRVRAGYHTIWESVSGAAVGCFSTLLVVKLLGV
ncbi:MAG: diacylglycerol kinase [Candidatus Omnitrophota bacterium]